MFGLFRNLFPVQPNFPTLAQVIYLSVSNKCRLFVNQQFIVNVGLILFNFKVNKIAWVTFPQAVSVSLRLKNHTLECLDVSVFRYLLIDFPLIHLALSPYRLSSDL